MVKYFVWWEIIWRWSKYVFTTPFPRFLFHSSVHVLNYKMYKVDWLWSLSINDKREKCVWVSHYWWSEQPVSSVCKLCVFSQFLGSCLVSGVRDKIGCRVCLERRRAKSDVGCRPGPPRVLWPGPGLTVNTSPGSRCRALVCSLFTGRRDLQSRERS